MSVAALTPQGYLQAQARWRPVEIAFWAATLIGISDVAGKYYVPQLGAFLMYLVMIVLLMWRPAGLFGRR